VEFVIVTALQLKEYIFKNSWTRTFTVIIGIYIHIFFLISKVTIII